MNAFKDKGRSKVMVELHVDVIVKGTMGVFDLDSNSCLSDASVSREGLIALLLSINTHCFAAEVVRVEVGIRNLDHYLIKLHAKLVTLSDNDLEGVNSSFDLKDVVERSRALKVVPNMTVVCVRLGILLTARPSVDQHLKQIFCVAVIGVANVQNGKIGRFLQTKCLLKRTLVELPSQKRFIVRRFRPQHHVSLSWSKGDIFRFYLKHNSSDIKQSLR